MWMRRVDWARKEQGVLGLFFEKQAQNALH
jgi:hypothetical protein